MLSNVVPLNPYEVYEFAWGSAIKKRNMDWEKIFIKPTGQEIDVTGINVILYENGIEFLEAPM